MRGSRHIQNDLFGIQTMQQSNSTEATSETTLNHIEFESNIGSNWFKEYSKSLQARRIFSYCKDFQPFIWSQPCICFLHNFFLLSCKIEFQLI